MHNIWKTLLLICIFRFSNNTRATRSREQLDPQSRSIRVHMRSDGRDFGSFVRTMETEVTDTKKLSISHQLKFGVERLLSDDRYKRTEKSDESVKHCDAVNLSRHENLIVNKNSQLLNAQMSNGYHHSLTLNNNGNYRSGECVSRSGEIINEKKNFGLCKQINTLRGFGEDEYVENGKIALLIG